MDHRLESFLKIIRSLIVSEGKGYDEKHKFIMGKGGQMSVRFAALMKSYPDIQAFLLEKRKDSKVTAIISRCKVSTDGKGVSRVLIFWKDSLPIIDEELKSKSSSYVLPSSDNIIFGDDEVFPDNATTVEGMHNSPMNIQNMFKLTVGNQYQQKHSYHSKYVQQVYKETGIQDIEGALNELFSSSGWNVEMRQKCLEKLISNLQSRNNMDFNGGSNSTDCVTICSSIRNFLSGLDYSTESRCVKGYFSIACGYGNRISSRQLEKIIGIDRHHTDNLKQRTNAHLPEQNHMTVDGSVIVEEIDAHVLEEEPPNSDDEERSDQSQSDVEDSDVDVIEVDDEGNDLLDLRNNAFNNAQPLLNALQHVIRSRKVRSDKVDLTKARRYWHYDTVTDYDTNSSKSYLCYDPITQNTQYHHQRLQHTPTIQMHKEFLQSADYLRHLEEFPEQTIGLTLFKRAKCHCIKWDKFRKCADTMEVQFKEYLKAMIRMITVKKEQCNCRKHNCG